MLAIVTLAAVQATADAPRHPWGRFWIPFALLFWGAVFTGVGYLLFRVMPARHPSGVERARDILAERLARGEISSEENYDRLSALS
jgi:putative membrane protein